MKLALMVAIGLPLAGIPAECQHRRPSPAPHVEAVNEYEYGSLSILGAAVSTPRATAMRENGESIEVIREQVGTTVRFRVPASSAQPSRERVRLEVRVPHTSSLGEIRVPKGELLIKDVTTPVRARGGSGVVTIARVAAVDLYAPSGEINVSEVSGGVVLETKSANVQLTAIAGTVTARIGSGNLQASDIAGALVITSTTGNAQVANALSDVRVTTLNGRIEVRCVVGRLDVSDTSGVVEAAAIAGDVDIFTSTGRATVSTTLLPRRRTRLRTLSGNLEVRVLQSATDFIARLTSFARLLDSDFPLRPSEGRSDQQTISIGRPLSELEIEAFNGRIRVRKVTDLRTSCGEAYR